MADGNYDEVTNTVYLGEARENIDPMFHWDLHFPERVSRLRISPEFSSPVSRRQRRTRDRCAVRYKTQPITFDEITEVDEDASGQSAVSGQAISGSGAVAPEVQQEVTPEMKISFKKAMTGFSRSMDGLVLGGGGGGTGGGGGGSGKAGSGSDKENTPCSGGDALPEEATPETGSNNQKRSTSGADSIRSAGRSQDGAHRKRMHRKSYNRNTVEEVPEAEIAKVEETE